MTKRSVNEYLYHQFGMDADEQAIADDWPFALDYVGGVQLPEGGFEVYHFADGEDSYYVLVGEVLDFVPTAEMSLEDLEHEALGSRWIAAHDPVDLATARPGDPGVPSGMERRAAVERLAASALPQSRAPRILEGLYLRRTGRYLALVDDSESGDAIVVGSKIAPRRVGFPGACAHRRLSTAVGQMLGGGELSEPVRAM